MVPPMPCPSCQTENPPEAPRCTRCGRELTARPPEPPAALPQPARQARAAAARAERASKRRTAGEDVESPFGELPPEPNRAAVVAYRWSVASLVPGLGLVLGPLALGLGLRAGRRGRSDPGFTGTNFAK